jgi:hypothetical protein
MPVSYEAPKVAVEDGPGREQSKITHPAFAQIRASRVSGGALLYGSDFQHQHFITVQICRSELHRELSRDWHHARDELIDVSMSEAQWATFISTLNSGGGTPCTLTHIACKGVPQIPHNAKRRDQFNAELRETLGLVESSLTELRDKINALPVSEKKRKELLSSVECAERNLAPNLTFVANQFGEHMETVTEHAKVEIEAYVSGVVQRAGLQAIAGAPPILLTDSAISPDAAASSMTSDFLSTTEAQDE